MARQPRAGRCKTRLARDIGTVAATGFCRTCLASLIVRLAHDPRWTTTIAVTPALSQRPRDLQRRTGWIGQARGDLGARMQDIFDRMPPGPVVIVGTDVPAIAPHHIARAFKELDNRVAVFGPATDGGYWLIGLRRRPHVLQPFAAVRWSTAHALADTLANIDATDIAVIDKLNDVDDVDAWHRQRNVAARVIRGGLRRLPT